jgi:hypothetical protein
MQLRSDMKHSYGDMPDSYTGLKLSLNEREYDMLVSQNLTLVQRNIPYNYTGCVLAVLPKVFTDTFVKKQHAPDPRNDTEPMNDQMQYVSSLFCAESIVMTLSVSLEPDHDLYATIHNLTATCTKPQMLLEALQSVESRTVQQVNPKNIQ